MLSFDDIDRTSIVRNLQRARRKWGIFSHLSVQEGNDTRNSGRFDVAVFQSILIFGLDSWVITPRILWELGRLHNWVAQRIFLNASVTEHTMGVTPHW